jgi:hypothetical protein
LFFAIAIILFEACSSSGAGDAAKDSTQTLAAVEPDKKPEPAINYPYAAGYSSDFKMGDPQNAKTVLELYKLFDAGSIAEMRPSFADTVEFTFSDGSRFRNSRDSLIKMVTRLRGAFKTINNKVIAWIPIHSNDKNEDYVLIWATEIKTSNKGVTDSTELHEGWRLKNGKIDQVFQYEQKIKKK